MKQFRLLRPDEIECRVQKCTAKGVTLLLYKTARTDADLLDETVGPDRWQNDFKVVDGTLYGGIGIIYPEANGECFWKWDAGTESNTEAEKGRASDAFKRAGFKWGIGRELYSAPFVFIPAAKCNIKENNGKFSCYDNFEVAAISYDDAERIAGLTITLKGAPVFEWGGTPVPTPELICADCGKPIYPTKIRNGETWTAEDIGRYTEKRYGRRLCVACSKRADNEA